MFSCIDFSKDIHLYYIFLNFIEFPLRILILLWIIKIMVQVKYLIHVQNSDYASLEIRGSFNMIHNCCIGEKKGKKQNNN